MSQHRNQNYPGEPIFTQFSTTDVSFDIEALEAKRIMSEGLCESCDDCVACWGANSFPFILSGMLYLFHMVNKCGSAINLRLFSFGLYL